MIDTRDGRVWVTDTGAGSTSTLPLVILHGFPTSSWDFAACIERLSRGRRVIAFDFLGFGFSEKPAKFSYSLFEQADVAQAVLRTLRIERAHVWAHDMGTSVATELCARRERGFLPFSLASLSLMNGSVHVEMAQLTFGQHLLASPLGPLFSRLNSARTFKAQMRRIFGKPPADEELDVMWMLLSREDGALRLPKIIGYIEERRRFHHRWIGALERLDVPTLIAWGKRDPVAILKIAQQLVSEIPGARLETWNDLGHSPQVEAPVRVSETLAGFLDPLDGS